MMIMFLTASGAPECPWLGTTSGSVVLTSNTTWPEFLSTATRRGIEVSLLVLKYMLFPSSATLWPLLPPPWTLASNFQTNVGFSFLTSNFQYCCHWLPTYMKPSSTSGVKYSVALLGRAGSPSEVMNLTLRLATLPLSICLRVELFQLP